MVTSDGLHMSHGFQNNNTFLVQFFGNIYDESIWFFLFPLSLNSLGLSLNGLRDNIGISISIAVREGVWESMVVGIWNSSDSRLHNWCMGIGISGVNTMGGCVWEIIGDGRMRIGGVACKESRISFSIGLPFLPLSLNSLSFSFSLNGLGDDIGIPVTVRVESMVTKVVWVSVGVWVGVGKSRCLNFHLLYNRLDKWGGVNIWVVKTICQIVGISLGIGLSIGLTLLPFGSLHGGSLSLSGSSGSSGEWDGEWESMSPETIVSVKVRIAVGENWSSLNLSGLYFNRLDDRYVGDCMVSSKSIDKRRVVDKELRVSLSICTDSSKEGNHQQELHVVTAL